MSRIVNGCCCLSLQTAGLIHGWLGIILFVFAITVKITNIINYDSNEMSVHLDGDSYSLTSKKTLLQEQVSLVLYICDVLISGLLIAGVTKNKHKLLLPWLVLRALGLMLAIPVGFILLLFSLFAFKAELVFLASIYLGLTGLFVWSWVVIYSLYQEIRNTSNTILSTPPAALPYCESQSMPNEPAPPYHLYAK